MRKLEIKKTTALINNLNVKTENHGEERVLATDINIEMNVSADILDMIAVDDFPWTTLLWHPNGEVAGHCMSEIGFHREFEGANITLNDGVFEPVNFKKAKLKNFWISPIAGKRLTLKFQARVHPTPENNGELSRYIIATEATVSISATPVPIQVDMGTTEQPDKKDKKKAKAEQRLDS